jgi:hypothetical protein
VNNVLLFRKTKALINKTTAAMTTSGRFMCGGLCTRGHAFFSQSGKKDGARVAHVAAGQGEP